MQVEEQRTNRQTWLYFNLVYCYLQVLQLKCSKKLLYTFNSKQLLEGQLETLIVKQTCSFKSFLIKKNLKGGGKVCLKHKDDIRKVPQFTDGCTFQKKLKQEP